MAGLENNEWKIIKKLAEGFGLLVEVLPWKFILIGLPLIGLAVALLLPLLLG